MPLVGFGTATMTYDIDNRMVTWDVTGSGTPEEYRYLSDNKRVWKKTPAGVETYYLYGVGGQKLLTCSVISSPFALTCSMTNVYFGGKAIRPDGESVARDRLGSVVALGGDYTASTVSRRDYFPYGEEIGTASSGNAEKFGTYHRDATTGLDYADQRYYAGTMGGRFLTADPYEASGGPSDPGSWNRYAYVDGDPVNLFDPRGLEAEYPDSFCLNYPEHYTCNPLPVNQWPGGGGNQQNPVLTCSTDVGGITHLAPLDVEGYLNSGEAPIEHVLEMLSWSGNVGQESNAVASLESGHSSATTGQRENPSYAVAAGTAAFWVVYVARSPAGQRYIGITMDVAGRRAAHLAANMTSFTVLTNLEK